MLEPALRNRMPLRLSRQHFGAASTYKHVINQLTDFFSLSLSLSLKKVGRSHQ